MSGEVGIRKSDDFGHERLITKKTIEARVRERY